MSLENFWQMTFTKQILFIMVVAMSKVQHKGYISVWNNDTLLCHKRLMLWKGT